MKEFLIQFQSVRDVEHFVAEVTGFGLPVKVRDGKHCVNGTDFMELFLLDWTKPVTASVTCSDEEYGRLVKNLDGLLAS